MGMPFSSQNFKNTLFGLNISPQKLLGNVLCRERGVPSPSEVAAAGMPEHKPVGKKKAEKPKSEYKLKALEDTEFAERRDRAHRKADKEKISNELIDMIDNGTGEDDHEVQSASETKVALDKALSRVLADADTADALAQAHRVLDNIPDEFTPTLETGSLISLDAKPTKAKVSEASADADIEGMIQRSKDRVAARVKKAEAAEALLEEPSLKLEVQMPSGIDKNVPNAFAEASWNVGDQPFSSTLDTGSGIPFGNEPQAQAETPFVSFSEKSKEEKLAVRNKLDVLGKQELPAPKNSILKGAKMDLNAVTDFAGAQSEFSARLNQAREAQTVAKEQAERESRKLNLKGAKMDLKGVSDFAGKPTEFGTRLRQAQVDRDTDRDALFAAARETFKDEPFDLDKDEPQRILEAMFEESVDVHDKAQYDTLKKVISRLPQEERAAAIERLRENVAAKSVHAELGKLLETPVNVHDSQQQELLRRLVRQLPKSEQAVALQRIRESSALYQQSVDRALEASIESTDQNTSVDTTQDVLPPKKGMFAKLRESKLGKWLLGAAAVGGLAMAARESSPVEAQAATISSSAVDTGASNFAVVTPQAEQAPVEVAQPRVAATSRVESTQKVQKAEVSTPKSEEVAPRIVKTNRVSSERGSTRAAAKGFESRNVRPSEAKDAFIPYEMVQFNKEKVSAADTYPISGGRMLYKDKSADVLYSDTPNTLMRFDYTKEGKIKSVSTMSKEDSSDVQTVNVNTRTGVVEGGDAAFLQSMVNEAQSTVSGQIFNL